MFLKKIRALRFRKLRKIQWAYHQKRWFGKWHLYVGIFAGFILAIVGLTGSILVFQDEIDQALNPELFEVVKTQKRIPIEEIIPVIQSKYPCIKFEYIMDTDENNPFSTYRFYGSDDDHEYFINPYTAELSGKRIASSAFIRVVTTIHRTLLIPQAGRYIVGLAALCLLILTISGIRLWLPKKLKNLRKSLSVDFRTSFKRQNYDWHNVLGVFSAPVVISLALTGLVITFNTLFIALLFLFNGRSPQSTASIFGSKSTFIPYQKPLSPKQLSEKIYKLFPDSKIKGISIPKEKNGSYRFDVYKKGTPKTGERMLFIVDQYSGKILVNSETDFPNTGKSYLSWVTPIHYGTFGGWPTRILALFGSLIPPALFITGIIIWWPRFKKQRKNNNFAKTAVKASKEKSLENISFSFYFRNGIRYALVILGSSLLCGALYGMISGIVKAPAFFMAYYISMIVVVNFIISVICYIFRLIGLIFRKQGKPLMRYFAYSLAFVMVFIPLIIIFNVFDLKVF